jgi:hypothetical protein
MRLLSTAFLHATPAMWSTTAPCQKPDYVR